MQGLDYRDQRKIVPAGWPKLVERMIYLPGAAIILYGIWLLLTS